LEKYSLEIITTEQAHRGADLLIGLIKQAEKQYPSHDPLDADDIGFRKGKVGDFYVFLGVQYDGERQEIRTPALVMDRDHEDMHTAAGLIMLNAICSDQQGDVADARTGEAIPALSEMMVRFALALVEKFNENKDPTAE
jgi:hypothetical protein